LYRPKYTRAAEARVRAAQGCACAPLPGCALFVALRVCRASAVPRGPPLRHVLRVAAACWPFAARAACARGVHAVRGARVLGVRSRLRAAAVQRRYRASGVAAGAAPPPPAS
jgi:hypothetical protein